MSIRDVGVAAVCLAAASAMAVPVIDQAYSDGSEAISSLQTSLVQSFQAGAQNMVGAGVLLGNRPGSAATVHISLWTALPTSPGAAQLASAAGTGSSGSWLDVYFPEVAVTPDATYFLVVEPVEASGVALMGSTAGTYDRGQVYVAVGTSFWSFPTYDYAFRTWTEQTTPVPEPSSLALAAAGLGVVGVATRLRRRGQA